MFPPIMSNVCRELWQRNLCLSFKGTHKQNKKTVLYLVISIIFLPFLFNLLALARSLRKSFAEKGSDYSISIPAFVRSILAVYSVFNFFPPIFFQVCFVVLSCYTISCGIPVCVLATNLLHAGHYERNEKGEKKKEKKKKTKAMN